MKRRVYIFLGVIILTTILLLTGHLLLKSQFHGYLYIFGLFFYVYSAIYLLFGVPRLIIYFLYGLLIVPILIFVKQYQLLWISIFTIIVVLNPLSFFESYLDKKLPKRYTEIYGFVPSGRYKAFYSYRRAMKEHYHLPQIEKLYKKPSYRFARTFAVISLFSLLVFMIIFSGSDIIIKEGLGFVNLLTVYVSFVLTIAIMVLYKRGFTSMFRVFKVSTFPAVFAIIIKFDLSMFLQIVLLVIVTIAMIGVSVSELVFYYTRVVYESYHYNDLNKNEKVFANAIYEPFIYNENKKATYRFTIKVSEKKFNDYFKQFLIYSNLKRTVITAYIVKDDNVHIYVEFYNLKTVRQIENRLKNLYSVKVVKQLIVDENYYEKKFLHNHEYIITRALSLANLLKQLDIEKNVIISTSMYFEKSFNSNQFFSKYNVKVIEEKEKYLSIEVLMKVPNNDFMIESTLRNLLLEMLIAGGVFIRVMVYY